MNYPELLYLAKYSSDDKYYTSRSHYEPVKPHSSDTMPTDDTFYGEFYRAANNGQMFRFSLVQLFTNTINTKPKHAKQILENYGNAIARINMKPPHFVSWVINLFNQNGSCFVCICLIYVWLFLMIVFLLIFLLCLITYVLVILLIVGIILIWNIINAILPQIIMLLCCCSMDIIIVCGIYIILTYFIFIIIKLLAF
eukprot:UN07515